MVAIIGQIYLVFFLVLELTYLGRFLYSREILSFFQQIIFSIAFAPIFLLIVARFLTNQGMASRLTHSFSKNIFPLSLFYLITMMSLFGALLEHANYEKGGRFILYTPFAFIVIISGILLAGLPTIRKNYRAYFKISFVALWISVIVDGIIPGSFSFQFGRAAGFPVNANDGAFALILLLIGLSTYHRFLFSDLIFFGMASIGVVFTLSRGGLICLALFILFYGFLLLYTRSLKLKKVFTYGFSGLFVGMFVFFALLRFFESLPMFQATYAQKRLSMLFFGTTPAVEMTDERILAAIETMNLIAESPLLGWGTGFGHTMSVAPHNQFLFLWLNNGLPAVLLYIFFFLIVGIYFFHRRQFAGVGIVAISFVQSIFSHNMFENYTFLLMSGILLGVSVSVEKSSFLNYVAVDVLPAKIELS